MDTNRASDESAILRVEADYDRCWANGDIDGLLACLTEDAVLVSPRGDVAEGHEEIRRELSDVLGGEALRSTHRIEVVRIRFVTDDVAVLDGIATVDRPGDGDLPCLSIEHRFTDVFVRRGASWLVAHIRAAAPRD
ncbi:nuclear transport factor 2 family protein [Gordonia sp. PKS22-38]|uniref:Nuclear transport factor 2 family protein n=1 Tax=Gordonia prachuapensis TaxID=3115651 RepID=A0ABU7MXX9_9ACTN|nr:nuclear transport factor 2 family protein [Gordonia sp. PKS22-38]